MKTNTSIFSLLGIIVLFFTPNLYAQSCVGTSTINITISAPPTATITNGASVTIPIGGNVVLTANAISGATYEWMLNGTVVASGINLNTYTATQAGSYTVEITNAAGCSGISAATVAAVPSGFNVPFKIFLQGAYATGGNAMTTNLAATAGTIPTTQPYNTSPWNYSGNESLSSIPSNMTDWVLIEAVNATTYSLVESRAAVLLSNGSVQDVNGATGATFTTLANGSSYHFIIRHRNHVAVMTSTPITISGTMTAYDFTTAVTKAFGTNQMKALSDGRFGLLSGDTNANGIITVADYNVYAGQSSQFGYRAGDCNLNRTVEVADFNQYQVNASHIAIPQVRYQ